MPTWMKIVVTAFLAFVISVSNALITLWSTGKVVNFSDVAEVSYGVAIIGGILQAAHTLYAHFQPPQGNGKSNVKT